MPSWLDDSPVGITFAALFCIVFLRAQGTYWIGRAVTAGLLHTRVAAWMTSPRMTRAIEALNRWGLPVVTVSFLPIGFQTAVNAAVGIAAFEASLALAARSPWALVAVLAVLLGVVVAVVVVRARSHGRKQSREQSADIETDIDSDTAAVGGHGDGRDHRDPPTRLHGGGFA